MAASVLPAGCVLSREVRRPGLVPLLACPPGAEEDFSLLPGVFYLRSVQREEHAGWHVPVNVLEAGRWPVRLADWPAHEAAETPGGMTLDVHQRRVLSFLLSVTPMREGCLVGGDPGVGKTLPTLQAAHLLGMHSRPVLVCAPLAAKPVWCGEGSDAMRGFGLDILPLEGTKPHIFLQEHGAENVTGRWVFVHYNILRAWVPWLRDFYRPELIVFDEIHLLANYRTSYWRAARALSRTWRTRIRYGLTGTPVPKDRMDLAAQLMIVQPSQWSDGHKDSVIDFGVRYAGGRREPIERGDPGMPVDLEDGEPPDAKMIWVFDQRTHTDELVARFSGVYLRYTLEETLDTLPKLHRHILTLGADDLDLSAYYDRATGRSVERKPFPGYQEEAPALVDLSTGKVYRGKPKAVKASPGAVVGRMTQLIGLLDKAKEEHARDLALELAQSYHHLVVFTWRIDAAEALHAWLRTHLPQDVLVCGPVSGKQRWRKPGRKEEEARRYAEAERAVFVGTRDSCGVAINDLRHTQAQLLTSLHWNPASNLQIEGRSRRRGNPFPEVHVYYLVARKTVDELFLEKLLRKSEEAQQLCASDTGGLALARALLEGDERGHLDDLEDALQLLDELEDHDV